MADKRLAEKLAGETDLLAGLILDYQRRYQMDDLALLRYLQIDISALARLIVARRPRRSHKVQDVMAIAASVGCPVALLWSIVDPPLTDDLSAMARHTWRRRA